MLPRAPAFVRPDLAADGPSASNFAPIAIRHSRRRRRRSPHGRAASASVPVRRAIIMHHLTVTGACVIAGRHQVCPGGRRETRGRRVVVLGVRCCGRAQDPASIPIRRIIRRDYPNLEQAHRSFRYGSCRGSSAISSGAVCPANAGAADGLGEMLHRVTLYLDPAAAMSPIISPGDCCVFSGRISRHHAIVAWRHRYRVECCCFCPTRGDGGACFMSAVALLTPTRDAKPCCGGGLLGLPVDAVRSARAGLCC